MFRKYLHALWAVLLHCAVLVAAHRVAEVAWDGLVEHVVHEGASLVRDELITDTADRAIAWIGL